MSSELERIRQRSAEAKRREAAAIHRIDQTEAALRDEIARQRALYGGTPSEEDDRGA